MRIAYLTSQYPATSHTFIRREVAALRALGVAIDTFSVRPPAGAEVGTDEERREAAATYTLLAQKLSNFLVAHVGELVRRPARYIRTLGLALRHRPPGLRAALLSVAHFGEAILLAAELRRREITHLHNHFANSGATVGLLASSQANITWSFTIHGISEFDYPAGLLIAEKMRKASFVACVSYFGRAQAARLVEPEQWPKLTIVRCGLELDQLPKATSTSSDVVRLIVVGRLSPEKGIAGILDAIAQLRTGSRVHLAIVGDGPLAPELRAQAASLGIDRHVEFLGRLSEAETLAEIARSDVLVLASFMEGLPIVLMEALALGKPVVASRVAGIPELVEDKKTGLLFSPSNWDEMRAALARLIDDAALREMFGSGGPNRIAEEFDIRQSATKLLDLFRSVAASAPTRSEIPSAPNAGTSESSIARTGASSSALRR